MAVGKLVRGALYVHRAAIAALEEDVRATIDKAVVIAGATRWNVARVEKLVIGLLEYEDFDAAAFPRLIGSTRVNVATGEHARTDFSRSTNPLILHRKEQLVMPDDPRASRWAELTRMLVGHGLFKNNHTIGRQRAWNERLAQAGLAAIGDEVLPA
jgi:DNA phosphorothioation-associated putative methyltransferase